MRTRNTRNLAIILAILIVIVIVNSVILFQFIRNNPLEKAPKPITDIVY